MPTRILKRPPKDMAETTMESEEAKLEADTLICDHMDKQDDLEGRHSGQPPKGINVVITPGKTSDGRRW